MRGLSSKKNCGCIRIQPIKPCLSALFIRIEDFTSRGSARGQTCRSRSGDLLLRGGAHRLPGDGNFAETNGGKASFHLERRKHSAETPAEIGTPCGIFGKADQRHPIRGKAARGG